MDSGGVRFTVAIVTTSHVHLCKPALQIDLAVSPWNGALLQSHEREGLVMEALLCF